MKHRRTTIYLESDLLKALMIKAAETDQSVSELVRGAVRRSLVEDAEELVVFKERAKEPNLTFETVLKDLRRRGRLLAPHQTCCRQGTGVDSPGRSSSPYPTN